MSYFRTTIATLDPYEPGEQPLAGADVVKLNTNENPYPPSPNALAALQTVEAEWLRRYPRPFADEFRNAAAEVLGVTTDRLLVGNGSDDILTMLFRSVTDPARGVAYPTPTYVLYRTLARIQAAPLSEVAFDESFNLPVAELVAANAALTLVASPNSPSGNATSNELLSDLADRLDGILAVDEAYVEFAAANALELTARHDNVVVLRTLSKSHALAGLRLGYAIASPSLIAGLAKIKDSYNVDVVASTVGAAAIRDTTYTRSIVERVCASRGRLATALYALGFRVWPSEANFLLVRPSDESARAAYHRLKASGILVRYFDAPGLDDKLRITVGTDDQNDRLLRVLGETVSRKP